MIHRLNRVRNAKKFLYCKQDEEQNRKSRPDEDGIENGTMVGIECGIKIRTKSVFGNGIRNGAEGWTFKLNSENPWKYLGKNFAAAPRHRRILSELPQRKICIGVWEPRAPRLRVLI
ncbi:hypothetical protein EVAR_97461_1 [Eumeta japonica]|uniref:Uncharacterized protein n=1 Tax=Eumeta variegata TaxID=151549 RepID=A0A4C1WYW1_EUMVA|nr:hypothetical protein EVAR_97461_1 [Eumeta japonica]